MPVIRLKSVVLPAPFGPITLTISPSSTCRSSASITCRPPNAFEMRFSSSSAGHQTISTRAVPSSPCGRQLISDDQERAEQEDPGHAGLGDEPRSPRRTRRGTASGTSRMVRQTPRSSESVITAAIRSTKPDVAEVRPVARDGSPSRRAGRRPGRPRSSRRPTPAAATRPAGRRRSPNTIVPATTAASLSQGRIRASSPSPIET